MKKILFVFVVALLFMAGCSEQSAVPKEEVKKDEHNEDEQQKKSDEEKQEPIEVKVDVEPVIKRNGKVYFKGETNLPDYAELMFTVTGGEYQGQTEEIVKRGKFKTEKFSDNGEGLPPGDYNLTITLSIASAQDEKFVEVAGENYENLTGDLMDESKLGKSMEYETTFTIERDEETTEDNTNNINVNEAKELIENNALGENDKLTDLIIEDGEIKAVVEVGDGGLIDDKKVLAETIYSRAGDAFLEQEGWEVLTIEFVDVGKASMNRNEKETNEAGDYFPTKKIMEQLGN